MTRLVGWEFFSWLGLRRVNRGGLGRLGDCYVDGGIPVPGFLVPDVVGALIEDGLVELGAPELDSGGLRRTGLTEAGRVRYRELCRKQRQRGPNLLVPPPQFVTTPKTPAGRRSSAPAPGGWPDPPVVPLMRWARPGEDELMHALDPVEVERAPARGCAQTLCGNTLPPDVATADHPAGELCLPCMIRFASLLPVELRQCARRGQEGRRGG